MQVFTPSSREEIVALREWLQREVDDFDKSTSRLWLGFVNPRQCNGSGSLDRWISQWNSIELVEMNMSIFDKEPTFDDKKRCLISSNMEDVSAVECFNDDDGDHTKESYAFGLCEAKLDEV